MRGSLPSWPHLYLSVPRGARDDPPAWAAALARERALRGEVANPVSRLISILVGGEGPDGLGVDLPALVRQAAGMTEASGVKEWTVEVDSADRAVACAVRWRSGGVTRLSLRGAAAEPGVVEALRANASGLDIAAELRLDERSPQQTGERIRSLIDAGSSSLALVEPEEGRGDREGAWRAAFDAAGERGWAAADLASAHAPGRPPRHAQAIRRREPVLGLGPGAASFRNPERRWNHPSYASYLSAIEAGADPASGSERLDREAVRLERLWSRLRGTSGVPCPAYGFEPVPTWERRGWVCRRGRRLVPTLDGWLQADHLAVELAARLSSGPSRRGPGGSTDGPGPESFGG